MCARALELGRILGPGQIVLLDGPMGAGKTTFVRALAVGLAVLHPERVRSPTFALSMVHAGPVSLVHVDLYRLGASEALEHGEAAFEALGLAELVSSASEVVVVEWAELARFDGVDALRIALARAKGVTQTRDLLASATGPRSQTLLAAWSRS